jgi:hypothetical protein
MSHYTIDELIARWKKEELTAEQAIGQILLLLKELERRMKEAGRRAASGDDAVDARVGGGSTGAADR